MDSAQGPQSSIRQSEAQSAWYGRNAQNRANYRAQRNPIAYGNYNPVTSVPPVPQEEGQMHRTQNQSRNAQARDAHRRMRNGYGGYSGRVVPSGQFSRSSSADYAQYREPVGW
jgi:hypothetical protein